MENARPQNTRTSAPDKRNHNPSAPLLPELEPPVFVAVWPSPCTRADEALQALIKGPLNQADYWRGWRLAAYVKSLGYDGWAIKSRLIVKPGCRREIAEYELDRADPGTAAALELRDIGSAQ